MALYHDGEYYPGCIVKISRSPALKFTVQFDGYSKEETETLDQTEIKPLPRKQKEKPGFIIFLFNTVLNSTTLTWLRKIDWLIVV